MNAQKPSTSFLSKALAMEKYEDLSQVAACMGWSVGLGIGDATAEAKNIDIATSWCAPLKSSIRCCVIAPNWSPTCVAWLPMSSTS